MCVFVCIYKLDTHATVCCSARRRRLIHTNPLDDEYVIGYCEYIKNQFTKNSI